MVLVGKTEVNNPHRRRSKDGRIIPKLILKTQDGRKWSGLVWINMETSGRLL
jgi:hypothetical protein